MKTNKDFTLHYKVGNTDYGFITVPSGTKVSHQTAMGLDKNYHFVCEFNWIKPHENGTPQHGLLFDVKHYGINIPREFINFN